MLGGRKLATFSQLLVVVTITLTSILTANALQFCGNDLANALSLVCSETGYNLPLLVQSNDSNSNDQRYTREVGARYKRGIVDECCRTSCSWATIETYCRPAPSSTTPENLQIQKRSDPSEALLREQVRGYSLDHAEGKTEVIRHQKRRLFGHTEEAITHKNNRFFHSSLDDSKRKSTPAASNKVKRNEKRKPTRFDDPVGYHKGALYNDSYNTEEIKAEVVKHDENFAKTRHPQGRHHRLNKTHHTEMSKGKGAQIGTVPPFFFGRTLVSPKARKHPFQ